MSAPVEGQEKAANQPAADGQKKQRKKKAEPLDSEQFTHKLNEVEAECTLLHKFYTSFNKHGVRTGPLSPSPKETQAPLPLLAKIGRYYELLCRKKKRVVNQNVKGFKQEKLLKAEYIPFFNKNGGYGPELAITPCADANGDGIFAIAQAISVMAVHVSTNGLKRNPDEKTQITFDAETKALFQGVLSSIKRDQWSTNDKGEIVTTQAAIQAMIPKLFDSKVPIHPTMYTEAEKTKMEKRREILSNNTLKNGIARKAKEDERKAAEKAAKKAHLEVPATPAK